MGICTRCDVQTTTHEGLCMSCFDTKEVDDLRIENERLTKRVRDVENLLALEQISKRCPICRKCQRCENSPCMCATFGELP
jgi:hypothetical protein